jgi:1,6-anhydro-N-acetylmuramate kinase
MNQPITVNLPRNVYERIRRAAEKRRRTVDEVVIEVISAAAPTLDSPQDPMRAALAQMAYMNDAALWQAARSTMPPDLRARLEALHSKIDAMALSAEEQIEVERLEQLYRDTLLVRAQAAALLKQRHYDVADPSQFAPLE